MAATMTDSAVLGAASAKLTFKEKLRGVIADAEVAQAQALHDQQLQDAQSLSTDLLINGFPSAFCEFHKLAIGAGGLSAGIGRAAHGASPASGHSDSAAAHGEGLPMDVLRLVHSQLSVAESSRRSGDRFAEFEAYNQLGLYFEQATNYDLATYQYRKCLEIAEEVGWVDGRMATHLAIGLVLRQQGRIEDSVHHHLEHLRLATELDKDEEVDVANQNLIQVHSKLAEAAVLGDDVSGAFEHLMKCLKASEACADVAAQGACYHQLGNLAQKEGDYADALNFQKEFLNLSTQGANSTAQAHAYFAMAECHEALGDLESALIALETYLDLTRLSSPLSHARACCKFGIIYYNMGKYQQAVVYFEKFFEVARSLGDMKVLDIARFNLGAARGVAWQEEYLDVVNTDIEKLLNWKNVRVPFTERI